MARSGSETRERILDNARHLTLQGGFSAMSLDELIHAAGITKGGFFYHFKSKADLGLALLERHARDDAALYQGLLAKAQRLSKEPLQQVLLVVGFLEEEMRGLTAPPEGCLLATATQEYQQFGDSAAGVTREALRYWTAQIAPLLEEAKVRQAPRIPFDAWQVAELLTVIIEGAFIMAKATGSATLFAEQLAQYRAHLELLFGLERADSLPAAEPDATTAGTAGV